jgi:hypothetical protein
METATGVGIPQRALRRLEFLAGEYAGTQTLFPPGGKRISYDVFCTVTREACERFLKAEFFADIPGLGPESFTALFTFSPSKCSYQMWLFSSTAEEPLHMIGDFKGQQLIMVSDPWDMPWGLQRLRGTFTPNSNGDFEYLAELWEPDGYVTFKRTVLHRRSMAD